MSRIDSLLCRTANCWLRGAVLRPDVSPDANPNARPTGLQGILNQSLVVNYLSTGINNHRPSPTNLSWKSKLGPTESIGRQWPSSSLGQATRQLKLYRTFDHQVTQYHHASVNTSQREMKRSISKLFDLDETWCRSIQIGNLRLLQSVLVQCGT